jgi:alpha-beta hydrolase superfamily lysophospholipase
VRIALPRRWVAATQLLVLAVTGVAVATASPAHASVTPGTVLLSATATLPAELSPLATGKKIQYLTTTPSGATFTASGLILTPKTGKTNKTVVWAHGTTGLADKCAPSANNDVFWPEARAAVAKLLQRGWTVAAPDYTGLGSLGNHPYLVGLSEARAIIDSVKAARNLDATLGTQYVIDGHSQGGQGGLFANQIAPSYDGALVLKGVAAIAPASNLDLIAPDIPGTPGQGYLVMALYGINAIEPTFNPETYLAPEAKAKKSVLTTGCLYEILDAYAPLTPAQLVPGGTVPAAVLSRLDQYGNPGGTAPSSPILIVHGTNDEAVPYDLSAGPLVSTLSTYGQPVEFVTLEGETHDGAVFASVDTVATWIAARFT